MIKITPSAMKRIKELLLPKEHLRIEVRGGGCSGLSYNLLGGGPEKINHIHDLISWDSGVEIVVDPKSMAFLAGTTLDYETNFMSQGFVFKNPNATNSCGCGSSFSV